MQGSLKITTHDIEGLQRFYQEVLSARLIDKGDEFASLQVEQSFIELYSGVSDPIIAAIDYRSVTSIMDVTSNHSQYIKKPFSVYEQKNGLQRFETAIQDPEGNLVYLVCCQVVEINVD
ncbi:hypothetical protein MMH89_02135 [Candidatus Comchoanobacter bicostacola]|uniref:VOC domain-containing protein n=1 Tax=Candidatus Comchoanobacter bicostacola TaxID=2919598 RepID=A0ABY5DKC6_9GAMM|nr:hypothetical protein [Candidatus Comchoanobacter bicostacola]UTC24946.1 hypothetical protein MMH89_02135 [Candidatus Comchoanobacter bicostacola]